MKTRDKLTTAPRALYAYDRVVHELDRERRLDLTAGVLGWLIVLSVFLAPAAAWLVLAFGE